jgi:ABC-2 type transport system permease protein
VVFDHVSVSPRVARVLNPGMTWGGWRLPLSLELGMVAVLGALMLVFAVVQFSRPE